MSLLRAAAASVLALGAFALPVGSANASTTPCTAPWCTKGDIYGTVMAQPALNLRTAPCVDSSKCGIVGSRPYGTVLAIYCYLRGDWVTGWGGTTNVWDLIIHPGGDGWDGYASDAWINTGADASTQVPQC